MLTRFETGEQGDIPLVAVYPPGILQQSLLLLTY